MKKDIQLSFTDKEITPWGGMSLMSRLLKEDGFSGCCARGVEVASVNYESPGWGKARRIIMVRQYIKRRPKRGD